MRVSRSTWWNRAAWAVALCAPLWSLAPWGPLTAKAAVAAEAAGAPRFKVVEVVGEVDEETRTVAKDLLEKELSSRPELAKAGPARAFDVSLKFDSFRKELKDPRPGGRLKQLAVSTKVSVFGSDSGSRKLAFSGEGETTIEAEVVERRLAEETKPLVRDAVERAIKEAADQAVRKLSTRPSSPPTSRKRKKP